MTPDQIEAERTKFEAAWQRDFPDSLMIREGDSYRSAILFHTWSGWLMKAEQQLAKRKGA